jgi:hypothetical protein
VDGPALVELSNGDETYYLPFEAAPDASSGSVFIYACTDIPEAYREVQGIEAGCEVDSAATVRGALALIDPKDMGRLAFEFVSPLPDLAQ